MKSQWKYRCPEGHAAIGSRRDGYYCQPCERRYPGSPVDATRVESFPVAESDDGYPVPGKDELLSRIVEICDQPTRARVKATELVNRHASAISNQLSQLHDEGAIEKLPRQNGAWWAPTDDGRDRARGQVSVMGVVLAFWTLALFLIFGLALGVLLV